MVDAVQGDIQLGRQLVQSGIELVPRLGVLAKREHHIHVASGHVDPADGLVRREVELHGDRRDLMLAGHVVAPSGDGEGSGKR